MAEAKPTEKLFKILLKELRPLFKAQGFRASGQNFVLESPECWVVVNFQKSRWAAQGEVTFYVNVAACSKRWLGISGKPAAGTPYFSDCDWRWRTEHFSPDQEIQQWTLRDQESLRRTLVYLKKLFERFVLPSTRTMTTEAELLRHTGRFEYPQLKTRAVILAATNQVDALRQTVATLMEKFGTGVVAAGVRDHLTLLRSTYPEAMRSIELLQT